MRTSSYVFSRFSMLGSLILILINLKNIWTKKKKTKKKKKKNKVDFQFSQHIEVKVLLNIESIKGSSAILKLNAWTGNIQSSGF